MDEKAVQDRLQYNPEIIELHLVEEDLVEKKRLCSVIEQLQKKGIAVYIHHPMRHNGLYLDIMSENDELKKWYMSHTKELVSICETYSIKCIIHSHYSNTRSSEHLYIQYSIQMRNEIEKIEQHANGCFLWEDTIMGAFSYNNPYLISHIIAPLNLNINFDISHAFISLSGSNERLLQAIKEVYPYMKYAHVVDSHGKQHDSLSLGEGSIDWKRFIPFLKDKPFIFEIGLSDFGNCKEMIDSVNVWNKMVSENKENL